MAIIVKLDDMLYRRRVTLTELSGKVGITLANLSILKTGKAKGIRFATLEAICDVLDCQPGDLLAFERGGEDDQEDEAPPAPVKAGGRA
jgi:putative transcriptional regulator